MKYLVFVSLIFVFSQANAMECHAGKHIVSCNCYVENTQYPPHSNHYTRLPCQYKHQRGEK